MFLNSPVNMDRTGPDEAFPPAELALRRPDGLLAVGGDLSVPRLLNAYRSGIFPWYSEGQPILWWSPNPRTVLRMTDLKVSRSLRHWLRKTRHEVRADTAFAAVIKACGEPRADGSGTWITRQMQAAYQELHDAGHAHSIEILQDTRLVGGLYGVAIGKVFFGESMFSRVTNASKAALVYLVRQLRNWDFALIDCQVDSQHLASLGATTMPRPEFLDILRRECARPSSSGPWKLDTTLEDPANASIGPGRAPCGG